MGTQRVASAVWTAPWHFETRSWWGGLWPALPGRRRRWKPDLPMGGGGGEKKKQQTKTKNSS